MNLKELRIKKKMTQLDAAQFLGVSLRSYKDYENNSKKIGSLKYNYMYEKLYSYNIIDEEHGILSLEDIKSIVKSVLDKYEVNFCYLFGSYAKNKANPLSDIDLMIDSKVTGLDFFGLVEDLRNELNKKVDLLKVDNLNNNQDLLKEILKDGIKIYG